MGEWNNHWSLSKTLLLAVVFSMPFTQASAYDGSWNLILDIKKGWQGFIEYLTPDPVQKQQLVLKHIAEWQNQKEQLLAQNLPVPVELDQTIQEKKSALESINTQSTSGLKTVIDTILVAKELGKIRQYVSEFNALRVGQVPQDQRAEKIEVLERGVNQLEVVKKHCSVISVNDLLSAEKPYERLKSTYCKALNGIPKETVQKTLTGI